MLGGLWQPHWRCGWQCCWYRCCCGADSRVGRHRQRRGWRGCRRRSCERCRLLRWQHCHRHRCRRCCGVPERTQQLAKARPARLLRPPLQRTETTPHSRCTIPTRKRRLMCDVVVCMDVASRGTPQPCTCSGQSTDSTPPTSKRIETRPPVRGQPCRPPWPRRCCWRPRPPPGHPRPSARPPPLGGPPPLRPAPRPPAPHPPPPATQGPIRFNKVRSRIWCTHGGLTQQTAAPGVEVAAARTACGLAGRMCTSRWHITLQDAECHLGALHCMQVAA